MGLPRGVSLGPLAGVGFRGGLSLCPLWQAWGLGEGEGLKLRSPLAGVGFRESHI